MAAHEYLGGRGGCCLRLRGVVWEGRAGGGWADDGSYGLPGQAQLPAGTHLWHGGLAAGALDSGQQVQVA
jgi:hypothetical protein